MLQWMVFSHWLTESVSVRLSKSKMWIRKPSRAQRIVLWVLNLHAQLTGSPGGKVEANEIKKTGTSGKGWREVPDKLRARLRMTSQGRLIKAIGSQSSVDVTIPHGCNTCGKPTGTTQIRTGPEGSNKNTAWIGQ